ncbi:NAD(P)/FAD-dependent oxidoreductase [Micromonospora radicis]|uniref:Ferredoxin n=1 Tax=Micromonospora radicis TaxID=1894971 RepID=A0A418MWT3_9ACTN|nr:FAD-dependent oxidoreductase [Micromonospora radicis]RIV39210.1 ferredoxin [Micromonospora radicis]
MSGILIVGGGQAAVQLAASLREYGVDRPIRLVGAESWQPYQRPPLSKAFLAGRAQPGDLLLRSMDFYHANDIDLVAGERVVDIRLGACGGVAETDSGQRYAFDQLALTTGGGPRRLAVDGARLDGVHYLRDVADALRLRADLPGRESVVVIGGGFVGLEAAATLRAQGLTTTVVEAADRLLARVVAPVVSDFYRSAHQRRGIDVRLGTSVEAITGDRGRVTGVRLADGTTVPADLVLVGIGMVAHTDLATRIGLDCRGGIVVDEYARTGHPSVVAAGDCTATRLPGAGLVRLESVQHATDQARVAAASLAGRLQPYRATPWFWSEQGDLMLQMAGLVTGHDRVVVRAGPDPERFCVLYYRRGRLLAGHAVNRPADYLAVRQALSRGASIPPDLAADLNTPLKQIPTEPVPCT